MQNEHVTKEVLLGEFQSAKHIKSQEYLFLNLSYLLEESGAKIQFGEPQYGNPETGFSITMYRVGAKCYEYAVECLNALGKKPVRECGVTMSVSFDTPEENNAFRDRFQALMDQAEDLVHSLKDRTPDEHYFLKLNPIIKGIEDTPNNHFIFLQASVVDDVDERVLDEVLGDYDIDDMSYDEPVEIKMICYRKKWRDRLVRYLRGLGIEEAI